MLPFSPPRIDQKIIDEVVAVLKSGWITTGSRVAQLEKLLAEYTGVQNVLCLNSATAALELALRWYGVKEGDEVIVPAYTYAASANVVLHCGAKPVLVDIGKDFNIDCKGIEKVITAKTKVIIPVDIAGFPCDYKEIYQTIEKDKNRKLFKADSEEQKKLSRIMVLADAAHSLGAVYQNKRTGKLADMTAFSFHAVKNMTTAEGGALCFNLPGAFDNALLYKNIKIFSLHGQTKDAFSKFNQSASWEYDVVEAGYKCNMPDILAAIGVVEMQRYGSDTLVKRKKIFEQYTSAFSKCDWAEVPIYETSDKKSSYHVYMLRIKGIDEQVRNKIIEKIFSKKISVNVHFKPLPLLSVYQQRGYDMKKYPMAYDHYSREISLPVYYDLSDENVQQVINAVTESVKEIL